MMRALVGIALGGALLAGCGLREPLRPAEGQTLPPAQANGPPVATADELLSVPYEFRPQRVDEPLTRSERRPVDPFSLPPTDIAGAATVANGQSELEEQPPRSSDAPQ